MATFTDDTMLITQDKKTEAAGLQKRSDAVTQWTQSWKLEVNTEKWTHVSFTKRTDHHNYLPLGGNTIPKSKYLEMHLDRTIKRDEYIKNMKTAINGPVWWRGYKAANSGPLDVHTGHLNNNKNTRTNSMNRQK